MSRKAMVVLVLVACLTLFGAVLPGCGSQEVKEGTVVIGFMTDLSGPAAAGLKYLNWGLEDQVKQMNEDEGNWKKQEDSLYRLTFPQYILSA